MLCLERKLFPCIPPWLRLSCKSSSNSTNDRGERVYAVQHWQQLFVTGYGVVWLPPRHCKLNPIELIYGDLKQYVPTQDETFKQKDIRHSTDQGLQHINQSCSNAHDQVEKLEEDRLYQNNILTHTTVTDHQPCWPWRRWRQGLMSMPHKFSTPPSSPSTALPPPLP